MNQDADLLNTIYQNAKMGEETVDTLMRSIDHDGIKFELKEQIDKYADFSAKAEKQMDKRKVEPLNINRLEKASAYIGTKINTFMDRSPSHIAEVLIEGSTMGVIEMTGSLHKYSNVSGEVKELADAVVAFENQNIERMKTYL